MQRQKECGHDTEKAEHSGHDRAGYQKELDQDQADAACDQLYAALTAAGLEPLYDDRKERAGGKFATMDLIGLPWRITVGPRGLKNGVVELTSRRTGESEELSPEEAVKKVAAIYAPHHAKPAHWEPMAQQSFHTWM